MATLLGIIKERNRRKEGDREITALDMLRKRRIYRKLRKTRDGLTTIRPNEDKPK